MIVQVLTCKIHKRSLSVLILGEENYLSFLHIVWLGFILDGNKMKIDGYGQTMRVADILVIAQIYILKAIGVTFKIARPIFA